MARRSFSILIMSIGAILLLVSPLFLFYLALSIYSAFYGRPYPLEDLGWGVVVLRGIGPLAIGVMFIFAGLRISRMETHSREVPIKNEQ